MEGQSICKRPQHCRGVGGGKGTSHSPGVTGTRGSGKAFQSRYVRAMQSSVEESGSDQLTEATS